VIIRGLQPWLTPWAAWLYRAAEMNGLRPRITSTFRSYQHQAILYDRAQRGQTSYPVAPPGKSLHQYGRAFDMTSTDPEWLGYLWKSVGGRWYASDSVHFEA